MSAIIMDYRPILGRILWTGKSGFRTVFPLCLQIVRFGDGRLEIYDLIPNPVDRNLCCGCHCEPTGPRFARPEDKLREAISSGNAHPDRDCFVAALLAMTGRAWILIIRIWYQTKSG